MGEIKIFEHKYRKIEIHYGYNNNPWTDEDEKLVQALLKSYDKQIELDKTVRDLYADFNAANQKINICRDELLTLTQKVNGIIETANDYTEKIGFPRPASFDDFLVSINNAYAVIAGFDPPFRELDKDMDGLLERMNDWTEYTNHEYDEKDEFIVANSKHIKNYENNSIDIVKFSVEEEMLEGYESFHSNSRRGNMDSCSEIYSDYKCLVLEITIQYERWKEFCQRLILLQYIFKEPGVLPHVFAN